MKHSAEYYANPAFPRTRPGSRAPDRLWRVLDRIAPHVELWTGRLPGGQRGAAGSDGDIDVVVHEVHHPATDVAALTLVAADGGRLPQWSPGCHVDVLLPSGQRRQYSLCGDPEDRFRYRIAVRRIPDGTASTEVHTLPPGARLRLHGPRNAFPFARFDRYVFLAGGIGITPLLPMARAAARLGAPFRFVYTGRHRDSMPFRAELPTSGSGSVEIRPDDEFGPPQPGQLLGTLRPGTAVYCCGPPPLVDAVRDTVPTDSGVALFSERFSPPPVVDGAAFEVELRRTGRVLTVPAERTVLDVVRDVRPDVAFSCRQGFCGTCRVPLLSGTAEHRDQPTGGASRRAEFAVCVSRSTGQRLVLDL
ncbi:PDR/VanB family oxidoreductase [Lipingzhangella sp. LS1_29]|uniref:PDR/VanB family oxidoreductase n=1 Tax=Lipingzhangella rawalii TaxID=2055835 RepID=A0ABU2H917_9ACTN|nr:PDR/VanB family oxidoreductase [Lipingzhangella rawalii]MDS1271786.1 PDR/VanB family oxidoreductase [Lipingzhangella rawalii]